MSIEAAIGRIDQIVQLQAQLFTPAGASASAASTTGGVAVGTSSAVPADSASGTTSSLAPTSGSESNQADFASALADAQAASSGSALTDPSGAASTGESTALTDPLTSGVLDSLSQSALSAATSAGAANDLSSVSGVTATNADGAGASDPPAAVQAMIERADSLVGKPYVWGGGHSGWGAAGGYDCSGFVSAVLHAGGYLSSPQDTQTLPSAAGIESGPGQYVTIYDRTDASPSDHVIINVGGQFYEAGGEAGSWGGGGGVEQITTPSAAYLASFNQVLHPEGL